MHVQLRLALVNMLGAQAQPGVLTTISRGSARVVVGGRRRVGGVGRWEVQPAQ